MSETDEFLDFVPLGLAPDDEGCAPDGLAGASDSLAPASPFSEDGCADAASHELSPAEWPLRQVLWTEHQAPDFLRIPRTQWRAAMATVPEALRLDAVRSCAADPDDALALAQLAVDDTVPPAPSDLARAAVRGKPQLAPRPATDHFRRANRQVNFRLTESEYADLATAAQLIGSTPTQLAGQLVRNGVRRALEEANRPAS